MHSPDSVLTPAEELQQAPSYGKLLPELLLALLGHTGEVFVEKALFMASYSTSQPSPDRCNFAVTDAPGLVSTSERSELTATSHVQMRPLRSLQLKPTTLHIAGKHSTAC